MLSRAKNVDSSGLSDSGGRGMLGIEHYAVTGGRILVYNNNVIRIRMLYIYQFLILHEDLTK